MKKLMLMLVAAAFLGTSTMVCFGQNAPKKTNTKDKKSPKKKPSKQTEPTKNGE